MTTLKWLVADTEQDFADKLDRLLVDESWNQQLADAGIAMIEKHFSDEATQSALRAAILARV